MAPMQGLFGCRPFLQTGVALIGGSATRGFLAERDHALFGISLGHEIEYGFRLQFRSLAKVRDRQFAIALTFVKVPSGVVGLYFLRVQRDSPVQVFHRAAVVFGL